MRRARAVCAVAFGGTAALACGLLLAAGGGAAPDRSHGLEAARALVLWAAPSALVGAAVARRLAAMPTAGGGGFVGAGVPFGAAVLLLLGHYLGTALAAPAQSGAVLGELLVPAVWWITLGLAALLSPLGALAGWLAWRRLHRRP